jgi:hypothetical protein
MPQVCRFAWIAFIFCFVACSTPTPKPADDPKPPRSDDSAFIDNPLRWEMISDQKGIKLYRNLETFPGWISMRGRTTVQASVPKIATAWTDPKIMQEWFVGLVENRVLRRPSDFQRVDYVKFKAMFPFLYADFIYQMTYSVLRDPVTLLIRSESIEDYSVPLPPETSRGNLHSEYMARDIGNGRSEIVLAMSIDTKGGIPFWDKTTPEKAMPWFNEVMSKFKQTVEDPKLKTSKEVLNYIRNYGPYIGY